MQATNKDNAVINEAIRRKGSQAHVFTKRGQGNGLQFNDQIRALGSRRSILNGKGNANYDKDLAEYNSREVNEGSHE